MACARQEVAVPAVYLQQSLRRHFKPSYAACNAAQRLQLPVATRLQHCCCCQVAQESAARLAPALLLFAAAGIVAAASTAALLLDATAADGAEVAGA